MIHAAEPMGRNYVSLCHNDIPIVPRDVWYLDRPLIEFGYKCSITLIGSKVTCKTCIRMLRI